jgi:hypothetical protein
VNAPHKIDISKGTSVGTVSQQWFMRPDDQKFLNLDDLFAKTVAYRAASQAVDLDPRGLHAFDDGDGGLLIEHIDALGHEALHPTNYGFCDLASLVKAPSRYLSKLPAALTADCLNHGFANVEDKPVQLYAGIGAAFDQPTLRCQTSTKYGRITDADVVAEVMKLAGSGTGDTRWKVPGLIDWSNMTYNANVDITKDTTTLFASDRDIFLFLVDDKNPVEVGKTAKGDPDLMFRGFYVWNSEVGARTFGLATMYLRGVCQNRCLWGVEGFTETTFKHTSGAPDRFMAEAAPTLQSYAETAASKLVAGVDAAKAALVTPGGEDANEARIEFLAKFGFSKAQATDLILTSVIEEGRAPESVWDYAQAMTALARGCQFQDQRVKLEQRAGRLLDQVTVDA